MKTNKLQIEELESYIKDVIDFPKDGILFKDIMPLLRNRFNDVVEALIGLLDEKKWDKVDIIAGIESRGFILAAAMASKLNKNFVPIRKAGKLPGKVFSASYSLEYGEDRIEMQNGSGKVILIDDVVATGGTMVASKELIDKSDYELLEILTLINLTKLNDLDFHVISLFEY